MGVKLTLREEQRVRMFENRVGRRISGPNRDKVTGSLPLTGHLGPEGE